MQTENERYSYLAGMIDADGSIYMNLQRKKTLYLRIMVYNTCEDLMDWLKLYFGGIKRMFKLNESNNWKPLYVWEAGGQDAYEILKVVKDHMVVKPSRAKVAIEAWENRGNFRGFKSREGGVPAEVIERRQAYVDELHVLNKMGSPPSVN